MTADHQDQARRALEQIAYGDDPSIPVAARTAALGELSRLVPRTSPADGLTPAQIAEELAAFGMPAASAVAAGPDAIEPPDERVAELEETLALAMEVNEALERKLAELTRYCQMLTAGRLLPPAPDDAAALLR